MDILKIYLAGILFLSATYFLSKIATSLLFNNEKTASGYRITIGIFLMSAIVGTIYSYGGSVYTIPLLAFLGFAVYKRSRLNATNLSLSRNEKIEIGILLAYFTCVFALQYFIFYLGSNEWAKSYADNYAYISQINLMNQTHKESGFQELEKLTYGFKAESRPYHFFEFWIALAGKLISGQNGYLTYTIFLISTLGSILLFQAYSFAGTWLTKDQILRFLLPILIFSTLRYSYLDEWIFTFLRDTLQIQSKVYKAAFFQNYGTWHFFSYLHGLKLIISGIFIFPSIFFLALKHDKKAIQSLLFLPLVSLSYIPFFIILYVFIGLKHLLSKEKLNVSILFPLLVLAYYAAFYIWNQSSSSNNGFDLHALVSSNFESFRNNYISEIFIIVSDFFENFYWLLLLPCLFIFQRGNSFLALMIIVFLFYPLVNLNHKALFKLFFICFTTVTFMFGFRYQDSLKQNISLLILLSCLLILRFSLLFIGNIVDIFQIYSLIATPVFYILVFFICCRFYKSNLRFRAPLLIFIVLCIFINSYGIVKENQRTLSQVPEDKGFTATLLHHSGPDKKIVSGYYSPFTVKPFLYYDRLGVELLHHTDNFYTTCMGLDQITKTDSSDLKKINGLSILTNMPFSLWLAHKADGKSTFFQEQIRFIKANQIKFIFRKQEYEREKLNLLNPYIVDSVFNHQGKYWAYILNLPK